MGKKVKKVLKGVSRGLSKVTDSLGGILGLGQDDSMKKQMELQKKQQEQAMQAQRDAAADLRNLEATTIEAGAGADDAPGGAAAAEQRKRRGSSLSASLGLRV